MGSNKTRAISGAWETMSCETCENYKPKKKDLVFQAEFDTIIKANTFHCPIIGRCEDCAFLFEKSTDAYTYCLSTAIERLTDQSQGSKK